MSTHENKPTQVYRQVVAKGDILLDINISVEKQRLPEITGDEITADYQRLLQKHLQETTQSELEMVVTRNITCRHAH